jgi:transposase
LGRTLDWLYAHDLTRLFAGIATRARQIFGITAEQVHVDTTSFSMSGEYGQDEKAEAEAVIAITYGYSREHHPDCYDFPHPCVAASATSSAHFVFVRAAL